MQERMSLLNEQNSDQTESLADKQFAGVCTDFAMLTVAMLRQAGFISGITSGFLPQGTQATIGNAHATAFVVWPDELGAAHAIIVDGTPHGTNSEIQNPVYPSIEETQDAIKQQQETIEELQKEELQQLIEAIQSSDLDTVRNLENGKLESLMNTMLTSMVKEQHLELLNGLLNYYWYTPLHTLDLNSSRNNSYFNNSITAELDRIRNRLNPSDLPAGDVLFTTISDFVDRFANTGIITDRSAAFRTLEQIFEAATPSLTDTEAKAAFAIVNYLRATRMVGKA